MATHWARCAELARRHPELTVEQDPIFIRDGDVWTSAGVTAGIDLALALVEADLGGAAALAVARQLVVFLKRPGGQTQFSAALSLQRDGDCFGALHEWIACNLGATLSTATLADRAGMSERSFLRRYREATGATPARTVERLRVEAAQQRLCEFRRIAQADRRALRLRLAGHDAAGLPACRRGPAGGVSAPLFPLRRQGPLASSGGRIDWPGEKRVSARPAATVPP